MTDKGMPDLMELYEQKRRAQKQYFSALRGSTEQKKWLMESKRLESRVDAEIVRCRQGQMDLFGEDTCEEDDKWYPQDEGADDDKG